MLNIFRKKDGAVTIFLILILVPVLALTGIFVEISRIELAKPIITSSADLALNTALTNYDSKLKDYYGLMGSAQSTSDTLDVASEYFKNCINSQIVDEDQLDQWWTKATGIKKNGEDLLGREIIITEEKKVISNLLFLQVPDLTVAAVKNANLSNPVFLQSQIVEFMKYRAPIEIAIGLFDELKKQSDNLKNMDKDKELQKVEQETYEAENELLQRLYDMYCEMVNYNSIQADIESAKENFTIENMRGIYSGIHSRGVRRYVNVTIQDDIFKSFKSNIVYIPENKLKENDVYNTSDVGKIENKLEEALSCIYAFDKERVALEEKFKENNAYDICAETNLDKLQFTVQQYHKEGVSDAVSRYYMAVKDLWISFGSIERIYNFVGGSADLKSALENTECNIDRYSYGSEVTESIDPDRKITNLYGLFEKIYDYYNTCDASYISRHAYNTASLSAKGREYVYVLNVFNETVQSQEIIDQVAGDSDNAAISSFYTSLVSQVDRITSAKESLDRITSMINGNDKYAKSGSLYALIRDYSQNLEEWSGFEDYSTAEGSYCQESKSRAHTAINSKCDISEKDISNFQKRIENINLLLEEVRRYLSTDTKYGDTAIYQIPDLSEFIQVQKTLVSSADIEGKITTTQLDNLATDKFSFTPGSQDVNPNNTNNPNIQVETPKLYEYMDNKFNGKVNENQKNKDAKDAYKTMKNDKDADEDREIEIVEDTAEDITDLDANSYPSGFTGNAKSVSIFDSIIHLATGLANDFEGTVKDARDELYVVEYCMNMFSYASYENEMKYNYMKENGISLEELNALSKQLSNGSRVKKLADSTSVKDKIEALPSNEEEEVTYNKSLTNRIINADNNYAYQREIEYILFGGDNADNMKKVKQELYKIRFSMNLIPGYKLFWRNEIITMVSSAISTATYGIVPEPLVKVVMILALVGAESLNDVNLLEEGVPVRLLKYGSNPDEAEWVLDVSSKFGDMVRSWAEGAKTSNSNVQTDKEETSFRMSYSNYITLILYFQLTSSDTAKVNHVYKRIGDVIQSNMAEKVYQKPEYKLSNCVTQFSLKYSAIVQPLILNLGIYNDYGNAQTLVNDKKWRTISGTMVRGY